MKILKFLPFCHLPISLELAEDILWWARLAFGTKSKKLFRNPHHHSSSSAVSATFFFNPPSSPFLLLRRLQDLFFFWPSFAPNYVHKRLSRLTYYYFILWVLESIVGCFLTGLSVITFISLFFGSYLLVHLWTNKRFTQFVLFYFPADNSKYYLANPQICSSSSIDFQCFIFP